MATILDGKLIRDQIAEDLKTKIHNLSADRQTKPKLVIIQVGNVPESNTYISQKIKFGEKIGALVEHKRFFENTSQNDIIGELSAMNREPQIHGIIVQLPIPSTLSKDHILESIAPEKDVDGMHSINLKKLIENDKTGYIPGTTKGVITMLEHYKIPITGCRAVVIGRSSLVGKPTALTLLNHNATVTVCHSHTTDIPAITRDADIIISAVGSPGLITKNYVRANQTVIDVGTTVVDGKLKGDVAFDEVEPIVEYISPVPGGAGPLTVASLFQNLLQAFTKTNE